MIGEEGAGRGSEGCHSKDLVFGQYKLSHGSTIDMNPGLCGVIVSFQTLCLLEGMKNERRDSGAATPHIRDRNMSADMQFVSSLHLALQMHVQKSNSLLRARAGHARPF